LANADWLFRHLPALLVSMLIGFLSRHVQQPPLWQAATSCEHLVIDPTGTKVANVWQESDLDDKRAWSSREIVCTEVRDLKTGKLLERHHAKLRLIGSIAVAWNRIVSTVSRPYFHFPRSMSYDKGATTISDFSTTDWGPQRALLSTVRTTDRIQKLR
jgi:hypothetical protein